MDSLRSKPIDTIKSNIVKQFRDIVVDFRKNEVVQAYAVRGGSQFRERAYDP